MLCLAGAGIVVRIATAAFTLSWSHTIEHTQWQERWLVRPHALHLETASVQGSGAGMDPGPGAVLNQGSWTWHPRLDIPELVLRGAKEAGEWTLCTDSGCQPLGAHIPADPVRLTPCP